MFLNKFVLLFLSQIIGVEGLCRFLPTRHTLTLALTFQIPVELNRFYLLWESLPFRNPKVNLYENVRSDR